MKHKKCPISFEDCMLDCELYIKDKGCSFKVIAVSLKSISTIGVNSFRR